MNRAPLNLPSPEYYLVPRNDTFLQSYEQSAVSLAVLLGADPDQAQIEMKDMVDFEIEYAKVSFNIFGGYIDLYEDTNVIQYIRVATDGLIGLIY